MTENMLKSICSPNLMTEVVKFAHLDCLKKINPHSAGSGWSLLYAFPNGYGASVVRWELFPGSSLGSSFGGSYGANFGLWELAVLDPAGNVCYTTPVAHDVLGWLTPEDVNSALTQIQELCQQQVYLDE